VPRVTCSPRGASLPPISAAQLQRLTRTLDQIVQTLEAHISTVEENRKDLLLQFQRIAQLQAELDHLKLSVAKLTRSVE